MENRDFLAEWHPQWGVLLAWPHPDTDWADNLEAAETCYAEIVSAISHRENVLLLCHDAPHQAHIIAALSTQTYRPERVHFVQMPYNDTWARDFGFITVMRDGKPLLLDFTFNAWGGKFGAAQDNAVNRQLAALPLLQHNVLEAHTLVMEGGSLETDGQGTLLTTEICLLNPNRNPTLDRTAIEAELRQALGVTRILWLAHGHLEGDDTDAHIDTLARFADAESIVYMSCTDSADSHYPALQAMQTELQALRQANGEPYRLFPIPMPEAIYAEGRRLPASYVNFLIINGAVLLPVYADECFDPVAIEQTRAAFPQHEIIPIDCRALIAQNGSLHCITMQIPQEVVSV
ncbi:agmatine deiminase family protein [Thiothrix subterranea]|uniref:agmatine deiminase family protein n=1 Tax=Thiothrix subterranea TaxID=2735563 RepID=UPI00192A761F|nr:agmatine deiminase family protein [Thiothrix subterranea]QQZ30639.1 agmatine deiminase family protein [Thiothrix subterranea]